MNTGKKSFSRRLSLNILLITSILFIAVLSIVSLFSQSIIADEAEESAKNLLHSTINEIQTSLVKVEENAEGASWLVKEKNKDQDYLYHITRKIVEENSILGSAIAFEPYFFSGLYYFSPYSYSDAESGETVSKQLGNQKYDYFYMDWYMIPSLLGEPCWSEPYFDEGGGEFMMTTYSYPIKDDTGHTYAIITADVSLRWITERLSNIKPYPHSRVELVSRSGKFISLGSDTKILGETIFSNAEENNSEDLRAMADDMVKGKEGFRKYRLNGIHYFSVYGSLSNNWSISITCSYAEVLFRAIAMQVILIILGIISLLALFIVCYLTIRKLTQPLTTFSESAMSIAKGDFNTPLPEIKSEDEIRQLRDSFDYMQHSLTTYIENLKATTKENERFESELNIASKIQMSMLPTNFPNTDKVELHAILHPAKEVGGDLYDFILTDDNVLYFTVGDVSGKGVPASLFMAITRYSFHSIANMGMEMDEVMSRVNNAVCEGNSNGMFVTMFAGRIDLNTGEFKYCNGGHNPIIVNGEYLKAKPNLAVGLFEDFPYVQEQCTLEKGSRLLLYTDGITEAERADYAQYGEDRLIEWMSKAAPGMSSPDMCESLFGNVKEFTEGNDQNDDMTIMAIKFK